MVDSDGLDRGLILNLWSAGSAGLRTAVEGAALATAVYLPLYSIRAVGGGDLKLMAAAGTLAGPPFWLVLFVVTALLGGVAAIAAVLVKRRLAHTAANISVTLQELLHFRAPHRSRPELDVSSGSGLRMPHCAIIALAALLCLIAARRG